jgi:hypothetical protein
MKMRTANPSYQPHLQGEDDEVDEEEGPKKLSIMIQIIKKNFHLL